MSEGAGRKRPKFAEGITQVRHANTVIRRLASQSGLLRPLQLEAEPEPADSTMLRGPEFGFADANVPDTASTSPSLLAPERPAAAVAAVIAATPPPPPPRTVPLPAADAPPIHTEGKHGEIVVIFGCRGGAGATTVAVNLGAELARTSRGAVVVDLDLQMGDVLCALDLTPQATIAELLAEIDELDEASLRRRLSAHGSGLFALSQGDRFDQLEQLRPDRIPALIAGLSRQFGTVIIDGLRDFSDLSISALDMADKIILLVPEDVAGVKNASRCLELFRRLGYGAEKLVLVVNRHDGKAKVTPAAIAATLKLAPLAVLASDAQAAQNSLDEGVPLAQLAPKSALRKSIAHLATRIGGEAPTTASSAGFMSSVRAIFGGKR